jgi:limonene-1,2-epoxide hydrolase
MPTPTDTVRNFFRAWGPTRADLLGALGDYIADGAVWENVGMATTRGPAEAIALMAQFGDSTGFTAFEVDLLHISGDGDVVLTERVDYAIRDDGSRSQTGVRVMGAFEVRDGKIAAWRDYFDTAPFMRKAKK